MELGRKIIGLGEKMMRWLENHFLISLLVSVVTLCTAVYAVVPILDEYKIVQFLQRAEMLEDKQEYFMFQLFRALYLSLIIHLICAIAAINGIKAAIPTIIYDICNMPKIICRTKRKIECKIRLRRLEKMPKSRLRIEMLNYIRKTNIMNEEREIEISNFLMERNLEELRNMIPFVWRGLV